MSEDAKIPKFINLDEQVGIRDTMKITSSKKGAYTTTPPLQPEIKLAITEETTRIKDSLTANFVTILGIFASFITFLGIEIQMLSSICDYWRLIAFSLVILSAVIIFVFFIYIFLDHADKKDGLKILGMIGLIVILLLSAFVSLSKAGDEHVCKITQLDKRFAEIEQIYLNNNHESLKNIQERVQLLENSE